MKLTQPYDSFTRITIPDPGVGQSVSLVWGDTWANPPARCMWTGDGGDILCRLSAEAAMSSIAISLPAQGDWSRRIEQIDQAGTNVTSAWLCW